MAQRIQVAGHSSTVETVLRVIAAVAFVVGIVLAFAVNIGCITIAIIAAIVSVPLEIQAYLQRSRRAWIEDLSRGLGYIHGQQETAYRDEQLVGIAIEQRIDNSQMNTVRTLRKTRLWMEGEPAPLILETSALPDVPDPTGALVNRLIEGLLTRMRQTLAQGGVVAGENWQLQKQALSVGRPGFEERFDLSNVAAIDAFDSQVCVWRIGSEQASAKIPITGRNACLLVPLVNELLPSRDAAHQTHATTGLGRVLFERKGNFVQAGFVVALLLVLGLVGAIAVGKELSPILSALVAVVGLGLCGLTLWSTAKSVFRCHERGVRQVGIFGDSTMHYDEVASFSYSATRQYVNGSYTGTTLALNFVPIAGSTAKRIQYSTSVKGSDDDLDALRDHIARVLAARMATRLAAGERVQWTDGLAFLETGIEYRPNGMLGRKDPVLLPFERYGGYNMDQGVFYLFEKEKQKAVVSEQVSAANFHPGYYLLLSLLHTSATTGVDTRTEA